MCWSKRFNACVRTLILGQFLIVPKTRQKVSLNPRSDGLWVILGGECHRATRATRADFGYFSRQFLRRKASLTRWSGRVCIFGKIAIFRQFLRAYFLGEKCPLSAGRVAFVILEVTQVTECLVFPNRALFTSLIQVNIGLVCRSSSQEFIRQTHLNRYGLVVHIRKDKY